MVIKKATSKMIRTEYPRKCCIKGCTSEKWKGGQLIFFQIPKNKEKRKLWLEACGILSDRKTIYVCELHFNLHYPGQRRLDEEMIPTLRLPNSKYTLSDDNECSEVISVDSSESEQEIPQTDSSELAHPIAMIEVTLLKQTSNDQQLLKSQQEIKPRVIKTYSKKDPVLFLKPEEIAKKARVEQFKQILSKASNQSSNDFSKTQNTENQSVSTSRAKKTTEALLTKNTSSRNPNEKASNRKMYKNETGKTEDIEMYVENNNGGVSCKCKKFNENITYYLKRIDELEDENELLVTENLRLKKELQK